MNSSLDKILIIDFGSQVTQLIARQIRELGVYCELINYKNFNSKKFSFSDIKGIILSGGPKSNMVLNLMAIGLTLSRFIKVVFSALITGCCSQVTGLKASKNNS